MLDCKPQLARFQFRARHAVMAGPMREQLEENNRLRYGALLDRLTAGEGGNGQPEKGGLIGNISGNSGVAFCCCAIIAFIMSSGRNMPDCQVAMYFRLSPTL